MKKRIITAILLVLFSTPLIYFGGWFSVAFASIICFGGITEILLNTGKGKNWPIFVYVETYLVSAVLLYWMFIANIIDKKDILDIVSPSVDLKLLFCIIGSLILLILTKLFAKKCLFDDFMKVIIPTLVIVFGSISFIYIRLAIGLNAIVYLLVTTCLCDVGAHIIGSKFGKHKLAPKISPNKSIEGAIGGIILATILGVISYIYLPFAQDIINFQIVDIILISFVLSIGAVLGDLFFSSVKRKIEIKDFSNILPGHGGILDRFDSLLVNATFFIIIYMGIIAIQGI